MRFLAVFLAILVGGFALLAWTPVNDRIVEPFTAGVAWATGKLLAVFAQHPIRAGTLLRGGQFAVNIRNGCNGLEALLIYAAGVLAFPASRRARGLGLAIGFPAILVLNLVRCAALYLTGVYAPGWFDASHIVIWQSLVIAAAVFLWLLWVRRFALSPPLKAPR